MECLGYRTKRVTETLFYECCGHSRSFFSNEDTAIKEKRPRKFWKCPLEIVNLYPYKAPHFIEHR